MSVTVDTDVLVYASNRDDNWSVAARSLLDRLMDGPGLVYLFWPVLLGYLRIVTHPTILSKPLSFDEASGNASAILARPHVRCPGEQEGFWTLFQQTAVRARGNDVGDAHIAALMRQHGVSIIYTRDRDFRRYDDIDPRDFTVLD
jgi:toxin-antitoxin system PIN domain toxin